MTHNEAVNVNGKLFTPFIPYQDIQTKIAAIAEAINTEYQGLNPLFVAILNGSFMFAADLYKEITIESQITFVKVASYRGTSSTGQVMTLLGLDTDIADRHIILIEDIVDTGKTLAELLPKLLVSKPASLQIATLLQKPAALLHPVEVKYVGFEIGNEFIVGYGLDYDGYGRNLKDILRIVE